MDDDKYRAWFDNRDFGNLSKSAPLQAAILTSDLIDIGGKKKLLIEENLISFCTSVGKRKSNDHDLSPKICNFTADGILDFLNNTNIVRNDSYEEGSLQDVIEFSEELIFHSSYNNPVQHSISSRVDNSDNYSSENNDKINMTSNTPSEPKLNKSSSSSKQNANKSLNNTVVQEKVAGTKRNPFQSAMNQLVQEGGTVKSTHFVTSNTSTNNNDSETSNKQNNTYSIITKSVIPNNNNNKNKDSNKSKPVADLPPELQHCDPELVQKIQADIVQHGGQSVTFDDIAGLEFAKKCVQEIICWPMIRPDIFTGLRALPRGLLLFGPPGTGKTLIGKAIAHQVGATFFSISASSLTSKWIGEGEQAVRTLFAVATYMQPSVVFIDEVDSLLCQRSSEENEASRRIKTEFLVQLDGAGTDQSARLVIVGATNRPEELDEAARRRFVKRLYIPLPDEVGRRDMFRRLLQTDPTSSNSGSGVDHELTEEDFEELVTLSAGFSGSDIRSLCTEAAMGPIRELAHCSISNASSNNGKNNIAAAANGPHGYSRHHNYNRSDSSSNSRSSNSNSNLSALQLQEVPPITRKHFEEAFQAVAPSVSVSELQRYITWNTSFGSYRRME